MRIGFDATVLAAPTRYTGTGRYAENLLLALARAIDADDEIVAFTAAGQSPCFVAPNLRWQALPRLRLGKLSSLATHMLCLTSSVRSAGIDVFHAPTVHTRPSLPPVPSGLPCPLVATVHDVIALSHYASQPGSMPWRMRRFYAWNLRRALRAECIITVSEYSKTEIARYTSADEAKIQVVHNGVQLAEAASPEVVRQRYGLDAGFVLYVGSMEPRKNLLRLLQAYEMARGRGLDLDLVLVTDRASGHAGALQDQLASMAAAPHVRLHYEVPPHELSGLYHEARYFVFPSLAEGFGLPPLEAMLCGTPVLASRFGSLPEVLDDAGHYVDALDPESIAGGLLELASNAGLRTRLSEASLRVASRYSWAAAAEKTLDVYRDVAGRVRVPAL